MVKRLSWSGSTLRPRSAADKAAIAAQLREQVWPLLSSAEVQPVIHETFELADAARAHELMESSRHIGKIMLRVAGE
jgi:NADPH:quinone reductase-like Zn-dependent oxidoreductase